MITSVLEHLKMEDIQLLLENRGLPSIGDKQSLTERLQGALCEEICEFEWEQGEVPACHAGADLGPRSISLNASWVVTRKQRTCCIAAPAQTSSDALPSRTVHSPLVVSIPWKHRITKELNQVC